MKLLPLGQRGFSLVGAIAIAGVLAVVSVGLFRTISTKQKIVANEIERYKAEEGARKAVALGSYMVAVNLVGCREGGWVDNKGNKCRWMGNFFNPGIERSSYSLTMEEVSGDSLSYVINDLPLSDGKKIKGELRFRLVEWAEPSNGMVGKYLPAIGFEQSKADDDRWMILVEAEIPLKDFKAVAAVGVRRPLGIPSLRMMEDPGACTAQCISGTSQNPDPECRGPQEIPEETTSQGTYQIVNNGPGSLYNLTFEKQVNFLPEFFPSRARDKKLREVSTFNVIQQDATAASEQVMVPLGSVLNRVDSFPCVPPQIRAGGRRRGGGLSVHQEAFATANYNLSVAPWNPKFLGRTEGSVPGYDMNKSATYPEKEANPTVSSIEPKRLGKPLKIDDLVDLSTSVTIYYVPSH